MAVLERTTTTPVPTVERYLRTRALTEQLAEPLSAEDQTVQSMPDASPTKWHRAHTTWFFETFVLDAVAGYRPFDPSYRYLFNSYYEGVGDRHPRAERGLLTRPGAAEVADYRRHVDAAMADLLGVGPPAEVAGLVELGLHHEQQHQELLLMDAKHLLSRHPFQPAYRPRREAGPPDGPRREAGWIGHQGGLVRIGHDGGGFAFDNEGPRHQLWVEPFEVADRAVTCGDWADFVADGGYRRAELWLSDGWAAVQAGSWSAPAYWGDGDRAGLVFTLGGLRPLVDDEPVCHVSYYEADAFARWAGARLPTEAEWELVARVDEPAHLLDLDRLHPCAPASGAGFFGDVWEWTSSAYLPYPGFAAAPGAVGEYNGKFMVDQHVLRGGCCATPEGHVRATYRNFFPARSRWPFTGLRLARSAGGVG